MQVSSEQPTSTEAKLQLLLFVDERPSSRQQVQQIHRYLKQLQTEYPFELQIVNVGEQPYLAEHFRLVATPALIKIYPEPRQTLAGSNLIEQLNEWWLRWLQSAETQANLVALAETPTQPKTLENLNNSGNGRNSSSNAAAIRSVADSVELIRLSDEVFRLKREQERLLEPLQFKARIIAMVAHDLRNPLTAVSLAVETLEAQFLLFNKKGSFSASSTLLNQLFKQARSQAKIIDRMIAGLLQVTRGPSADLQIQPQKLNLIELYQDVEAHVLDRAFTKSQSIQTDLPNDLPAVYADRERVRQVLINLLDNAMKYTPEGGIIRISCLHRTTQKVQVSVCDTGPGIPEENYDRIFEERFRLKRDEAKDGYGIGLALCQRIIRAHYGQIWVDSASNGGSCFHFTLPVHSL
jgi:two-component system, OmpR family, clock-associated histidine kinase SasA